MKKVIALLLALLMLTAATVMTGCSGEEKEEDKGYMINVFLASNINTFDPADGLTDEAGQRILSLVYEGLTRIDEKGKLQKAIAKNWSYKYSDKEDCYVLEINLKNTHWNDGRAVSADDFVFAWKRQLEPEFMSETASALMLIKNARAVKHGDMTIDDLGLYAPDTTLIQVQFDQDIDYMQFLENCASLSLMPLREDLVVKMPDWGSTPATIATNGPFYVKNFKRGEIMEIERNIYYYRDNEEDRLAKYVTPYRFTIDLTKDADAQLAAFDEGTVSFISELPLSQRAARAAEAVVSDTNSVGTFVLNTTKAPFNKKEARQALSVALDRNEIVKILTFAKPAGGLVGDKVWETVTGTSFRQTGGSLINAAGDISKAKSLLSAAGVSSGKFTIKIREGNPSDLAIAEYAKGVWEQLGFSVTIKEMGYVFYENPMEYQLYTDDFSTDYRNGDFDVIMIDYNQSVDPFTTLGAYSIPFAGGAMDLANQNYDLVPHIGGYSNEAYDAVMEEAFAIINDRAARSAKLHEAEKILMDDMPVIPLIEYQNAYLIKDNLVGIKGSYIGMPIFNKMKDKDYVPATEPEETEAPETVAE